MTTCTTEPTPDEDTHRLLAFTAYALTAVVGATVLLVSSHYLRQYAIHAGMDGWLAWTLVVALDAGGIGGGLCWVIGTKATRTWGRAIALGNLAASVLGNVLGHLLEAKAIVAGPWMQILTGVVYPAELWAMVHLALVLRTERARLAVTVPDVVLEPAPAAPRPVAPEPTVTPAPERELAPPATPGELAALVGKARQVLAHQPGIGRGRLATELGCTNHQARLVLEHIKPRPLAAA